MKRVLALLLLATTLLSIFTGCNTADPVPSDPGSSTGSYADTTDTDGTDPNGMTGNETLSGTETTAPSITPTTEPSTDPSGETSEPTVCAHKWSSWSTMAATCTVDGAKTRTCTNCGEKESETIPAAGHSYGSWSVTVAAACDSNGTETRKCASCGNTEAQSIAATDHNWDAGKVTTAPVSCSDMGIKTYTCTACGKTKTEQIKGNHTFGSWQWEEYTFQHSSGGTYTSHRKYRTCTKCGYKETDGTADHICQKGSDNHVVTTVKEGTCSTKATMRSTCKICGWYIEYEGKKDSHTIVDKEVHLSDYGAYTNELDATVSECTSCGDRAVVYYKGEGWSDNNRYRVKIGTSIGSAYAGAPVTDDFAYYDHPTWQMVRRDFVYDSDGYVKQYTQYWWYNGQRYSQVIKCGEGEIEAWFTEYGLTGGSGYSYHLRCYGTYWAPYSVSYTS